MAISTDGLIAKPPELLRNSLERRRNGEEDKPLIPPTRLNGSVSPHKLFDAMSFDLEDFKRIRSAVEGATVNDAVLAVIGNLFTGLLIFIAVMAYRAPEKAYSYL